MFNIALSFSYGLWLYAQVVTSPSKSSMDFPCTQTNVMMLSLARALKKHYLTQDFFEKKTVVLKFRERQEEMQGSDPKILDKPDLVSSL